jgi:hypothetical protein
LKEEAVREGRLSVDLMPVSKEAYKGSYRVRDLATIYVMVGEHDAALDQVEYLLSIPASFSVQTLRLHPDWDPLHDDPRFQALLDKYE